MKLAKTEQPGFQGQGKEVASVASPDEIIRDLVEILAPGQVLTGVRVLDPNEHKYEPSSNQALRRFEFRRISEKVFTLAIEQNFREIQAESPGSSSTGIYASHADLPHYMGTYLFLGDNLAASSSAIITDYGTPAEPSETVHKAYSKEDSSEADISALQTMCSDILSGKTEMRVTEVSTTSAFNSGLSLADT